jgi:pantothenate synthetase
VYLNTEERKVAPVLYTALSTAKNLFIQQQKSNNPAKTLTASTLLSAAASVINQVPEVKLDYLNVVDMNTGMDLQLTDTLGKNSPSLMLSGAIFLGRTRLIDNVLLTDQ